ncbi:NAD(P)H-binding protein [Streptomyces roseifaciens]|uniref:NAD(P)H-binding protein n=1 Tax=Streptomyces roseifaciens TaxID=1488406 RepID=UPI000717E2AE|nr:NAD(P)H-binding protein [Streptomyces roseifaciens]
MTTLVTGSRGRVGRALIDILHARGHAVRAASRTPGELTLPDGVPSMRLALDEPETFRAALDGVASVFLYAEASHTAAFARAAADAGVRHIVLLSSSSVHYPDAATHPVARPHREAEQALAAGPVTATFLRPGVFATNTLGWTRSVKATGTVDLPYPGAYTDPIHEQDLAEAAFTVLTDPARQGGAYTLSGPEVLTFLDQAEQISRVAGVPVTVNPVSPEAWKEAAGPHLPGHFADALLSFWKSSDGKPGRLAGGVEELTGRPARTFATWVEDHAADFRP